MCTCVCVCVRLSLYDRDRERNVESEGKVGKSGALPEKLKSELVVAILLFTNKQGNSLLMYSYKKNIGVTQVCVYACK